MGGAIKVGTFRGIVRNVYRELQETRLFGAKFLRRDCSPSQNLNKILGFKTHEVRLDWLNRSERSEWSSTKKSLAQLKAETLAGKYQILTFLLRYGGEITADLTREPSERSNFLMMELLRDANERIDTAKYFIRRESGVAGFKKTLAIINRELGKVFKSFGLDKAGPIDFINYGIKLAAKPDAR